MRRVSPARSSTMVSACSSYRTLAASPNAMPCLRRFASAFRPSHSTSTNQSICTNVHTIKPRSSPANCATVRSNAGGPAMTFRYHLLIVAALAALSLAACSDDANSGTQASPWQTISHAVASADSEITIRVSKGTYDAAHGETFPITLKPGQKLIGDTAHRGTGPNGTTPTLIQGEAAYVMGFISGTVIIGADNSRIAGFSIAGVTGTVGYAEIVVDGVTMESDHNTFLDGTYCGIAAGNEANLNAHDNTFKADSYGLVLDGSGTVHVHNNEMEGSSYDVRAFNVDSLLVEGNSISASLAGVQGGFADGSTTIQNNTFNKTPGDYGSIICTSGAPTIRGNTFTGETALWVGDGGAPDAGTVSSPGHNNFSAVSGPAIRHSGVFTVMAVGNTWAHDPPTLGVDYLVTGTGSVVTQ